MKFSLAVWFLITLFFTVSLQSESTWYKRESKHFVVIYLEPHTYLLPHILNSAENALAQLMHLFNFEPSEKIVINTHDFSDYGSGGTTTVPHNFMRLEIEPLEPGYENIPFNDRIQWLIAHELVHIVVNELASNTEAFARSLFSKVPPEQDQPLSIFYSLLTNYGRYTPRWHQEGIAVFMETWLNGGFGRILANFDEMYFRTLVLEHKPFSQPARLDTKATHDSFLSETLNYLYGARFAAFLAAVFGVEKVMTWYYRQSGEFFKGFESKFKTTFGTELSNAWRFFIEAERKFQRKNLKILASAPLTPIKRIQKQPMGWVTQPHIDHAGKSIIFGNHRPHHLTAINLFDFSQRKIHQIGTLPSPSIIQIASTAYDKNSKLFFFTTNNNQLFRDIWVLDVVTKHKKLLFKNYRVGDLTVSAETHELWGIRHSAGKSVLVYSAFPYRNIVPVVEFKLGDDLHGLSISPSGRLLAATLHQSSGQQAIIVADVELLKQVKQFTYKVISEDGSPEFSAWSPDETYLYWNAYVNGVSNIYSYNFKSSHTQAMSHVLSGLFRPVYLTRKFLFAFEFSSDGFIPVIIPNQPAARLPAIHYFGQKVVNRNPQVTKWSLKPIATNNYNSKHLRRKTYSGISHLQLHSFLPVISGFQDQKVVGLYVRAADPLFTHDFGIEAGISPFRNNSVEPRFHFRGKYEYDRKYRFHIEYNASDFYDLFNQRKSGLTGTKVAIGNTHYWKYDNPHKIKQTSELAFYSGIEAINDNVINISIPDFMIFETSLNSRNIRRTIGSVDNESGNEWTFTLLGFGVNTKNPQVVAGLHLEWDHYMTFRWPHSVLHFKLATGYLKNQADLAIGKFYFGGFGNRYFENRAVKQYREAFRFPGMPIYSKNALTFAKLMFEHNLPPLRFGGVKVGQHLLSYIDTAWFTQGLLLKSNQDNKWINLGGQINFVFKHWYNLESTLSAGIAQAWYERGKSWEWFISFKILRN